MVGTGEIKYPVWTKTNAAARQFDIELSSARERKPWPKITWPSRLGVDAAGQLFARHYKTKHAKKDQSPSLEKQKEWCLGSGRRRQLSQDREER